MSVLIGIPSVRATISCATAATLMRLTTILNSRSIRYKFSWISYAEVAAARNILAAEFLEGDYDTFIGIDDDVGIGPIALEMLLDHNSPVVGVYLPQRSIDLNAFEKAIVSGMRGKNARFAVAPYIGCYANTKNPEYGTIGKVEFIGTGFHIVQRTVLETIIERDLAPELRTTTHNFDKKMYGFFSNIVDGNGAELSEDFSFCRRVTEAGFDVYAYLGPGVTHTGTMSFES